MNADLDPALLAPWIVGIVGYVRSLVGIPGKWAPGMAMAVGIVLGLGAYGGGYLAFDATWRDGLALGIRAAIYAMGGWSAVRGIAEAAQTARPRSRAEKPTTGKGEGG